MATAKKAPAKKKVSAARKYCSKVIHKTGIGADGRLKKGYKYAPGGRIVKVKPAAKKKPTAKKKPAKRPASKKK